MAKEKQETKQEEKLDVAKIIWKLSNEVLRQGYTVKGDGRALKITPFNYKPSNQFDEFESNSLYEGKYDMRSSQIKWELKGKAKELTGLTLFEIKVFGYAKAIIIPKEYEYLLRLPE